MSKRIYTKPPLSFAEQINLLVSRGLIITDLEKALTQVQQISYFRLSAYFLPYQSAKDKFIHGTSFDQIIQTYSFDRDLRLLVFDCIERIEIAIRTQVIYQMSTHYHDAHWQDNQSLFAAPYYNKVGNLVNPYADLQAIIWKAKTARTPEVFIRHYTNQYDEPANPPAWMCLELLTIGELSHVYRGLKNNADKSRIAQFFDLHPTVFTSWLHSIAYVRNICAHHARLWNKDLAIEPDVLLKPRGKWVRKAFENNKRIFYFLCVLQYLLLRANPENNLRLKLDALFNKYPNIPLQYLGIPSDNRGHLLDWKSEDLWS